MSKLTKMQKMQITGRLLARWRVVIEEDHQTDGFYEDVASALGHGDISEISTEARLFASGVAGTARAWLARMPEVR